MTPPPPLPTSEPVIPALPRAPRGQRLGLILAVVAILGSVAFVLEEAAIDGAKDQATSAELKPSETLNLAARYFVGLKEFMRLGKTWNATTSRELTGQLDGLAHTPADELRVEMLRAALLEHELDRPKLEALAKQHAELAEDTRLLLAGAQRSEAEQQTLVKHHGWMARLAKVHAEAWKPESWEPLRQEAMRFAGLMAAVSMAGMATGVFGLVLSFIAWKRWRAGLLAIRAPMIDRAWAGCLVEGFAIYLAGFTFVMAWLARSLPEIPRNAFYGLALFSVIAGALWPRWRGMPGSVWREALGFHRGEGWWREAGHGVLGWIAGLPLLGLGVMVSSVIVEVTGQTPTHPIAEEIASGRVPVLLLALLAVVWAPLTEEAMFRGLLFPGLSAFSRWLVGGLVGAFIFAVIHPQGWAGVPPIMALALTLSALRLTRGSLIAPMTAHALNNGLVTLLLIFAY